MYLYSTFVILYTHSTDTHTLTTHYNQNIFLKDKRLHIELKFCCSFGCFINIPYICRKKKESKKILL